MNPQKQFTGFLSSVAAPGQLSLTVASATKAIISAASLYAVARGLDAGQITGQVQAIIDTAVTAVTAGMTVYHTMQTVWGLVRKLLYALKAQSVVTQPVATPVSIPAQN